MPKGDRNQFGTPRSNEEVFCENSPLARHRVKERILKQALLPYVCFICCLPPIWNNEPMPLILDHINGINNDNRLTNLRFVCSNCDSQLSTYKARNKGRSIRLVTESVLKTDEP